MKIEIPLPKVASALFDNYVPKKEEDCAGYIDELEELNEEVKEEVKEEFLRKKNPTIKQFLEDFK